MLDGFKIYKDSEKRVLSIVEIWDGSKIVKLEFFSYKDSYIKNSLLNQNEDIESESSDEADEEIEDKADYTAEDEDYLKFSVREKSTEVFVKLINKSLEVSEIEKSFEKLKQEAIKQGLFQAQSELRELNEEYDRIEFYSKQVSEYLQSEGLIYICNYSVNEAQDEDEVLLCKVDNLEIKKSAAFLEDLSQKVFLAAPATQVFLFLSKESRKLLFRDISNDKNNGNNSYYSELQTAKTELPGFFAYDFLAVDLLIESFKAARDRDFQEAIETGEYGNNYKELMNDLNGMLSNKEIKLDVDLSGVNFKLIRNGGSIELNPEDLSHGELTRLGIYMWIKYHNIENAIVLMDEIEIAFHPDWQYQIISDLQQWAPNNQYILATHSYELCQALTPSHVKELEPKLIKKQEA